MELGDVRMRTKACDGTVLGYITFSLPPEAKLHVE